MSAILDYTPYYCEENVYRALKKWREIGDESPFDKLFAVLFSSYFTAIAEEVANKWKSHVPYRPYKSNDGDDLMLWDYHVICVVRSKMSRKWYAVDFDSQLRTQNAPTEALGPWTPYCVDMAFYVSRTFFFEHTKAYESFDNLGPLLDQVRFRIMEGDEYLCTIRSDRSHMVDRNGRYSAAPPPQQPITEAPLFVPESILNRYRAVESALDGQRQKNNLVCFINMTNTMFPGTIVDRHNLMRFVAQVD